jgi:MerR family transcriptional regulator, mercuric resistance operon regulatory protein
MTGQLTIGRLAEAAGVNVETIRYYQRRGLLEEPSKPLGRQRSNAVAAAKRVRFIKRAQQLGFTLAEVEGLLRLDDGQSCRETRLLAEQKLAVIEQRIADLARMRRLLRGLITECSVGDGPGPVRLSRLCQRLTNGGIPMAFDEHLAERVRRTLGRRQGLSEKRMFGGLAFLLHGNVSCGIHGSELIVRIDPKTTDSALREPGTHIFDITGRPMKGWLLVAGSALGDEAALERWIRRGLDYAATLPRK